MSRPRISYTAQQDAKRGTQIAVLASIYRLVLDSARRNAAGVVSTNGDGATVKNGKEVTHVDQRPG